MKTDSSTDHRIINVCITEDINGLLVTPVWSGVDRPHCFSWGFRKDDRDLAERLASAITAGVVFYDPVKMWDNFGKSFVSANCRVLGRTADADLKQLGF